MASKKGNKVIADLSIHPIGVGTSVSSYVKEAIRALGRAKGIRYQVTPMSTVLEANDLDEIFSAIKAAHSAVLKLGARRIEFVLRVDDRRDKPQTLESRVKGIKR